MTDNPTYRKDRNEELLHAVQHLLGLAWLDLAGTRRLHAGEVETINQLLEWYSTARRRTDPMEPALNTQCANCGASDAECWKLVRSRGRPCCGACAVRATHSQDEPGYVAPWKER